MKIKKLLVVMLIIMMSSFSSCQSNFDQKIWLENNDFSDTKNPRANMVKDLMHNYLKIGMKKEEVIKLLGKPSSDTLGVYIPRGVQLPDSLDLVKSIGKSKEEQQKALDLLNEWFKNNYKAAHLLDYPIGWAMIDPVSLVVKLDDDNLIDDFWIGQH